MAVAHEGRAQAAIKNRAFLIFFRTVSDGNSPCAWGICIFGNFLTIRASAAKANWVSRRQSRQRVYKEVFIMAKNSTAPAPAPASTSTPMTAVAASRIQSATARGNGGQVQTGSFAARAQKTAAGNAAGKK
jgi:hypothetical protein